MTRVPQELKNRVEAEIKRCAELAENAYGNRFNMPTIKYNITGHTLAGTANDRTYTIRLNPEMLIKFADSFIEGRDSTVAHEFAHLVDGIVNPETRESRGYVRTRRGLRRAPRSVHGPTWKRIMMVFGCDPNSRCHEYDLGPARRKSGTIMVECSCGCGKKGPMGAKRAAQWRADPSRYGFHRRGGKMIPLREVKEEKEVLPLAAKTSKKASKTGTKKEKAIQIYRQNAGKSKDFIISRIALECNMSQTGATTYYYIARKEA